MNSIHGPVVEPALEALMNKESLNAVKRSASIPSMPMVAMRCWEMTQQADVDHYRLVELLGTDPIVAADILKLSNSPLFGVMREVPSLRHAITLLDVQRFRELVLIRYLTQRAEALKCELIEPAEFWRRSVATAVLSSKLADARAPLQRDDAFIAGLLSDIGVCVLCRSMTRRYAAAARKYGRVPEREWLRLEREQVDTHHGEVSALVAEQWKFSTGIVEAVRRHHDAAAGVAGDESDGNLARIVGGASLIVDVMEAEDAAVPGCDPCLEAMQRVDLEASALIKILDGIESEIPAMAAALGVEIGSGRVIPAGVRRVEAGLQTMCAL